MFSVLSKSCQGAKAKLGQKKDKSSNFQRGKLYKEGISVGIL